MSLFPTASRPGGRDAPERPGVVSLAGRLVEYRLFRSRRRSLGMVIDAEGLALRAPQHTAWRDIVAFVHAHERWIVAKLDAWAARPRPRALRGVHGEALPLFGALQTLALREGPPAVHCAEGRVVVSLPAPASRRTVIAHLLAWLKHRALETLAPRAGLFAAQLGRDAPHVTLSNARRRWGACSADGRIRLNWRLVHVAPTLADYVVAHEVAHLVELNHSKRFWRIVESLYPDWRGARGRLALAGAALPRIGDTT